MDKAKLLKRLLLAHPIVKYHYGELEKAYKQPSTIPKTMAESAPITGELMSAYQAYDSSGKARNAFAKDKKGEGAGHAVNAILGLAGAIPGLGMIARATKRGKRVTDAMLPKGVNAFIDGITPNVKDARRTMQIFVGPKSATANHVALSRAQEMERQGINRSEIWQATGWGRGRDGQWRYEIDDSGARMVDPFGNAQTTDRHLAADVSRGHGPHQPMHLDDFITHPEFTRAMGEKTPRVFFDDMPIGSGYYFPKHDTITQGNGNFLMGDGGKGVALHEMQHAAQWRNDFDIGGAPKTAKQHAQWRLRKDALEIGQDAQRHTDLQRQLEAASAAEHLAKLNRLAKAERIRPSQVTNLMDFYENSHLIRARFGAMPKQGGAARDEWLRNAAGFMYNRFAAHLDKTLPVQQSSLVKGLVSDPAAAKNMQARLAREMQKTLPASRKMNEIGRQYAKIDKLDDYSAYKRLAGEVEARNVQTRADFSADERRRVPPWRTQDTPDEDQILGLASRFFQKNATPSNIGAASINPRIDTPEFKKWFGSSVVNDAQGQPLTVYKGMPFSYWEDKTPINSINSKNGPWAGFFSSKPDVGSKFGNAYADLSMRGGEPAGVVMANLRMERPLVIDAGGRPAHEFQFDAPFTKEADQKGASILSAIKSGKYDGVVIKNTANEGDIFVPLKPEQIKSIYHNRGYKKDDPDFY